MDSLLFYFRKVVSAIARQFKDFTFNERKFSDLNTKYISVFFDNVEERNLSMNRSMMTGETNRYRIEANYFADEWTDTLPIELNIIKDPCEYLSQEEMVITKQEIREITRWLTSPHFPMWIKFEELSSEEGEEAESVRYKGYFNDIQTQMAGDSVIGLKLFFKCTTPFGYTDDITNTLSPTGSYTSILVQNDSDELYSYCYPIVNLYPTANTDVAIINLSDCEILTQGTLSITSTTSTYFLGLINAIDTYGELKGYGIKYNFENEEEGKVKTFCNETFIEFTYVDDYSNNEMKCVAYYDTSNYRYYILHGGAMRLSLSSDLDVHLDCQRLIINDSLGRMITYDKLGVSDVDNIYWLRLLNGQNSLLIYANNCEIEIIHTESRKVGE